MSDKQTKTIIYRGWRIEKYSGVQTGYETNRSTRSKVGLGTKRKYKGWELFYLDGGSKIVDTLAEAKAYIDRWEEGANHE